MLKHSVNGKVVSKTLCTSHVHAERIWSELLAKLDPFVRNGCPIRAVHEGSFEYSNRGIFG